ncbi:hypothetical protein Cgig2_029115 [Carnegiea gigantea]|uniref:DUF7787 domain-containing protein n=1 Tax=Carnegiea gigantea TaxID=171969 RepID=A0A9Q1KLF3_9CARY|nr:hypothetical protein Cgig2_029115 [Carnegiea gigantea]
MENKRKQRNIHLHLEDYTSYFHYRNAADLGYEQLNQIIHLHGFFKLRGEKVGLVKALNEVDNLLDPHRSTINYESVASDDFCSMTIDEVNADLDALEWQEFQVQSLQSLSSNNGDRHESDNNGDASVEKRRRKWGRNEKERKVFDPVHLTKPRSDKSRVKRKRLREIGISI